MVLTGIESTQPATERLLNFVQSDSRVLADTITVKDDAPIPGIRYMLTPTILIGILFSGFILFIFLFAILQLFYVQSPTVFVSESIDFGKIEKWSDGLILSNLLIPISLKLVKFNPALICYNHSKLSIINK